MVGKQGEWATLIGTTSFIGYRLLAMASTSAYSATKFAVRGLTQSTGMRCIPER